MSRALELYNRLVTGGEQEIELFIRERITEELFLDYKRSANNGSSASLDANDRKNLAKAISGFGNSEGGIIIWGVDCRKDPIYGDIPSDKVFIENPIRFKSLLEQATSGLTIPPHKGVIHHAIMSATENEGFVITLIPGGVHSPYQTIQELSYYMRAGSNFAKVPHAVLAGMFGRRPAPSIKHTWFVPDAPTVNGLSVKTYIGINIKNFGQGIAESFYLNVDMVSHPGPSCGIEFKPSDEKDVWWGRFALGRSLHIIARPDFRLPPGAYVIPVSFDISLKPPFNNPFEFLAQCGASDCEIWEFKFSCSPENLQSAYDAAIRGDNAEFNNAFFRSHNIVIEE